MSQQLQNVSLFSVHGSKRMNHADMLQTFPTVSPWQQVSQCLVEMNVLIRTSCNQTQSDSHFHCWILSWFEFEFVCSSLLSPFPACFFPFICVSGVNRPCVFLSFFLVCLFCSSPVSPVFLPVFPVLLWFVLYFYVFIVLQLSDLPMPALCVFLPSAFFLWHLWTHRLQFILLNLGCYSVTCMPCVS